MGLRARSRMRVPFSVLMKPMPYRIAVEMKPPCSGNLFEVLHRP